MKKSIFFTLFINIFFIVLLCAKQYWLLHQLNMQFSNEYHTYLNLAIGFNFLTFILLFKKRKHQLLAMVITDMLGSLIIFLDLVYYRYFGDFITIPVLSQSRQTVDIKDSIFYLIKLSDFKVFLSIPIWILLLLFNRKLQVLNPFNLKIKVRNISFALNLRFIAAILSLAIGFSMMYFPIHSYVKKHGTDLFEQSYSNAAVYRVISLPAFHGLDIKKFVDKNFLNKESFTKTELSEIDNWFNDNQMNNKQEPYYGIAKKKNVVIFQFESLQAFVINQKVSGQEITPNLNKLAKDNVYFSNMFDQTGQGRTSDAEIMVNASLYPLQTGSVHVLYPDNTFDSIAHNLDGYGKYSFHGNNKSFWNRYLAHASLGFDKFYSLEELKDDERLGPFLSDGSLLKQTSQILSTRQKPFYAFIVGVTSHHPFNFANSKNTLNVGELEGTEVGNYLKAVHYVDAQVGTFINDLKEKGLWDDTIFITYGDHNTGFVKDDPTTAKFLNKDINSTDYYLEDLRIPLIMHVPGDELKATTIPTVGGLLDVAPTLFHLLGKEKPKYMFGNSLFSNKNNTVVLRNGGYINQNYYFDNTDGKEVCYDLQKHASVSKSFCSKQQPSLLERLSLSDKVIQNNLLKKFKNTR